MSTFPSGDRMGGERSPDGSRGPRSVGNFWTYLVPVELLPDWNVRGRTWNLRSKQVEEVVVQNPRKFTMRELAELHRTGRLVLSDGGRAVRALPDERDQRVREGEERERSRAA